MSCELYMNKYHIGPRLCRQAWDKINEKKTKTQTEEENVSNEIKRKKNTIKK